MSELNISNVFKVLKLKLKSLILIIVLLDVILLAYTFIMPQLFTSELSIMPPKNSSSGGGLSSFLQNLGGGALSIGGIGEADQSKLFGDILKSKTVTKQIVEKLQLDMKNMPSEASDGIAEIKVGSKIFHQEFILQASRHIDSKFNFVHQFK